MKETEKVIINPNAIPVFNDHKEEIFRKIAAGEELTGEENQIINDFIVLCETLIRIPGFDFTKDEKDVFQVLDSYRHLTGKELISEDVEKKPKI